MGDVTVGDNTRVDVFLDLLSTGRAFLEDRSDAAPPVVPECFEHVSETLATHVIDEFVRLCKLAGANRAAYRSLHATLCAACQLDRRGVTRHLLSSGLCDPCCKLIEPIESRPVHVASSHGFGYIVQLLLEYRADPLECDGSREM